MNFDLSWPRGMDGPLLVVLVATIAYVGFHYLFHWTAWLPRLDPERGHSVNQARAVHIQRLGGVLCLGLLPALVAAALPGGPATVGLGLSDPAAALGAVGAVLIIVLPVVARSASRAPFWEHYPLIRARRWTRRLYLHNALGWIAYLLAYEFFFRGFLLFTLARWLGVWPAIALSTLAYVYAHLPKPHAGETVGTLPMGVLFAVIALDSGGIWGPWLAHCAIALTSDWVATWSDPSVARGPA